MAASQTCQANDTGLEQQNSRSLFLENLVMHPSDGAATAPAGSVPSPTVTPATSMPTQTPTLAGTAGPTYGTISAITHTPTQTNGGAAPTTAPEDVVLVAAAATLNPTITPTIAPTIAATSSPTSKPTTSPTVMASGHPTSTPSRSPTAQPSAIPTKMPTPSPSIAPTSTPSLAPSEVPSPAPTVTPDCIDDLSKVHDMEINIQDTSKRRKYWLCPDTVFNMGTLHANGTIIDGQSYIMLRPNVIYQCGLDGSRSNNCTIQGGDFGVTSFYGVYEGIQETVDNAIIQGLTFVGQNLFSVVLEAAGDVTFQDCVFQDQENMAPVLIQWNGEAPLESTTRRLRSSSTSGNTGFQAFHQRRVQNQISATRHLEENVTLVEDGIVSTAQLRHKVAFKQCVFRNNRANKQYGLPGMIENTYQSELVIYHCLFENNDYGETTNPSPFGYAIRSFGPLTVEASCFDDNEFLQDAPIVVYNDIYSSVNNYATPKPDHLYCGLMALYNNNRTGLVTPASSLIDEGTPDCVEADVDTCLIRLAPTLAPTEPPTMEPTVPYVHTSGTSRIHLSSVAMVVLSSILLVVCW